METCLFWLESIYAMISILVLAWIKVWLCPWLLFFVQIWNFNKYFHNFTCFILTVFYRLTLHNLTFILFQICQFVSQPCDILCILSHSDKDSISSFKSQITYSFFELLLASSKLSVIYVRTKTVYFMAMIFQICFL